MLKKCGQVGRAIYPKRLRRILWQGFLSTDDTIRHFNLDPEDFQEGLRYFLKHNMVAMWMAPCCPNCGFTSPHFRVPPDTEVLLPATVTCDLCEAITPTTHVQFQQVYEVQVRP